VNTRLQSTASTLPEPVISRSNLKQSSTMLVTKRRLERKRQQKKQEAERMAKEMDA
jgi:hypothetical protein